MPRKQRFKPSRKPKLPQAAEVTEIQRTAEPARAPQSIDIETAQPARSQADSSSVIESSGGSGGDQDRA
jgi:hypothetical protein